MVPATQAQIDEAVMIAKNSAYKLAYELSIEAKYGQDISCCLPKLKLLWMYENALACHVQYIKATGTIEITDCTKGNLINILVNGVTISGVYTCNTTNQTTEMTALTALINSYQSVYVAFMDLTLGSKGKIVITGPDCNDAALSYNTGNTQPHLTVSGLTGGVCANNCLSDEKAIQLIAKIKSMCTN